MKQYDTVDYSTPIQLKLPVDLERIIKISDAVYSFSEVMAHIDLQKCFVEKGHETGRPKYDREKLLKIVLFAFMEFGYCSVRFIQKLRETDIRFLWLLEEEAPSHMSLPYLLPMLLPYTHWPPAGYRHSDHFVNTKHVPRPAFCRCRNPFARQHGCHRDFP